MKKAGYAAIGKEGGRDARTAKLMKMHKNYDIIFASSEACRESIAEIFDYSVDYIAVYPLPITDLLRDENYKNEITKRVLIDYPQLTDKKNIVYAPTFRHDETWLQEKLDELIQAVDYSSHNLIFKPHPLSNLVVTDNRVIVDKKYSSIEMIIVCDAVIVDYSSIIHEVAILGKPMYFYAFDYENFCGERGFFIDYLTEIPGNMYRSASSLFEDIVQDDYDFEKEAKFLETYIDLSSADCTLDIVNLIAEKLNTGRAHE
jgi:CDP-ribitol ribitolphosphotransferase